MKVCFETFGCRLNKAEALQMEADYLARGWQLTEKHAEADLFVIRGCSVTARAQRDCEKLITHLKRHYPTAQLRVLGCLDVAKGAAEVRARGSGVFAEGSPRRSFCAPDASIPTRTARAYLKVQDGCAGKCTFCIVPKFRGASRSEDFSAVTDRAKRFIDAGYHEIVVTGCNLSLYASQGKRLPDLVSALAELDSGYRIRIGSIEPGACAIETIHAMSEHANVCRFLHLTVQSGSERILQAMRRPYSVRDIDKAVTAATKRLPRLGLGCDLMTGFPGESELDHTATCGLLKRLPFNNAHVFPFSERTGTPAAAFQDAVPKALRSSRAHELSKLIRSKRESFAKSFLGQTVEIVVEDEKSGQGWSGEYLSCKPATGTYKRKSIVPMSITRIEKDILYGRPL